MALVGSEMRARQHAQAAVRHGAGREGDPGGDFLVRRQAEIGRILVPGNRARVAPVLGEDRRTEQQEVGSDEILDCVEDRRIAAELDEKGKGKMALDLERDVGIAGALGLVDLDAPAAIGGLVRADRAERGDMTLAMKLFDLRG
jgi:hypothetical protein